MTGFTLWSSAGALGAALTLGAARQATRPQQPARLDVPKIVAQLDLSGETRTAVVPELNRLNELLAQPDTAPDQRARINRGIRDVFRDVFPRLTPPQRVTLHQALRDAGVPFGWGPGGHMGSSMMAPGTEYGAGGCWESGTMGPGAGGMGWGGRHMDGGGHMNGGHMGWMGSGGRR